MKNRNDKKVTRRRVLQASAGAALAGATGTAASAEEKPGLYETLGVKRVINAAGTFTNLGGSVMAPEAVAAWVEASRHFVNLTELQDRVGERIAKLIGVDAALVTTGAAGALVLAAAAAVTRGEPALVRRLPDTTGMRNEVILQKSHHTCYDNQLTDVGVKLIDVETPADVKRVVGERTAMMFFMNYLEPEGKIGRREWLDLARQHRVTTLIDAAADVPPVEGLSGFNKEGFDLVAFSGGKALRGPNDTGLLLGRKELIDAAKRNTNPHCGTFGRMMKVGKEDMAALHAAVERYVRLDHKAEWREWERRIDVIEKEVRAVASVECERIVPPIANRVPHLRITWDEKRVRITPQQLTQELAKGDPPVILGRVHGTGNKGIIVSVFVLLDGEELVVAERLRAALARSVE
jgi:L-seryl-tRNA(Ser) seleniumtransferase